MKKCSKCKEQKPIEDFASDVNRRDGLGVWCKECRVNYYKSNYQPKTLRRTLSDSEHDEIATLYLSGMTSYEIASLLGVSQAPILRALKIKKIAIRSPYARKTPLDITCFDVVTPDSAYWVGFLYADGHITGNRIMLGLQERDTSHLEKFRSFLGVKNKITGYTPTRGQRVMKLSTRSQHIVDCLVSLGLNKLETPLVAPDTLCDNPDFWRGVIDGDGSVFVSCRGIPTLTLNGNIELMEQFLAYCKNIVDTQANVHKHSSIYRVRISGNAAINLIAHFYRNSSVSLDRKQHTAERIIG